MRVVTEYMLREFWRYFLLLSGIFMFVYLLVDFLDRIDNYIEYHSTFRDILMYYVYRLPWIVLQMTAVSVLLSVIITLSLMSRNNEIVALKAAGVSVYRLAVPFLLVSLFISLITFALAEGVVPHTNARASQMWYYEMRHYKQNSDTYEGKFKGWYRSDHAFYNVDRMRKHDQVVEGVSLYFFDKNFRLTRRVEAETARYGPRGWVFYNGMDKAIGQGGTFKVDRFAERSILLPESIEAFRYAEKSADEMSLGELNEYIKNLREEGYDTTAYRVDRQVKFSLPLFTFVLTLLAIPLALRQAREASLAQAIGLGVAVTFAYIVIFGLARSLGLSGTLPVFLAGWLPTIIFTLAGTYLLVNLRQ